MSAQDVRKLHSPFLIYEECMCDPNEDEPEFHNGRPAVYIEDIGYTCAEPIQTVCHVSMEIVPSIDRLRARVAELESKLEAAEQHVTICQRANTEEVERRRKADSVL